MYDKLAEFPFDSDRKRMSVIVKHKDKHFLMTKGADNVMLPRCSMSEE
jgi:Ca2+-transporting ATPase